MRSTDECVAMAERCEGLMLASTDPIDRHVLLATANIWRNLARLSMPKEPLMGPPWLPPAEARPEAPRTRAA